MTHFIKNATVLITDYPDEPVKKEHSKANLILRRNGLSFDVVKFSPPHNCGHKDLTHLKGYTWCNHCGAIREVIQETSNMIIGSRAHECIHVVFGPWSAPGEPIESPCAHPDRVLEGNVASAVERCTNCGKTRPVLAFTTEGQLS